MCYAGMRKLLWSALTCQRFGCDLSQSWLSSRIGERGVKPPLATAVTGHRTPKRETTAVAGRQLVARTETVELTVVTYLGRERWSRRPSSLWVGCRSSSLRYTGRPPGLSDTGESGNPRNSTERSTVRESAGSCACHRLGAIRRRSRFQRRDFRPGRRGCCQLLCRP